MAGLLRPILTAHDDCPALFAAVVDHGRLTALGAVGVRKAGDPTPVTRDDDVHLGSDTKAMTALLVGRLVQAHQLNWTDPMGDLFPDSRPAMRPDMAKVTVADLLAHRAGLPHDINWGALPQGPLPARRAAAVRAALSVDRATPAGKYAYSNVGYVLLGAIVERKTGRPWEAVIGDEVFTPLKMTTAGFGPPSLGGRVDQPWGHVRRNGTLTPVQVDNPPVAAPAGQVHCSMADWAKFVALYCRHDGDATPVLLDSRTLAALTTPAVGQTYNGGWATTERPWAGGRVLTHNGSNTTWTCTAWVAPTRGFAVLAATNSGADGAAKACDDVAAALIKWHAARR